MAAVTTKVFTKDKPVFSRLAAMPKDQLLGTYVTAVPFCVRVENCLSKGNIRTLGELVVKTHFDLLKIPGMGRGTLAQVEAYLAELGLSLAGTPPPDMGRKAEKPTTVREARESVEELVAKAQAILAEIQNSLGVRS